MDGTRARALSSSPERALTLPAAGRAAGTMLSVCQSGISRGARGRAAHRGALRPSSRRRHSRPAARHGLVLPDTDAIEAIIDAAFWASLRREEGYVPKISLALLSARAGRRIRCCFERPLPLDPSALVRVAPAVERPGIHLGVWRDDGDDLRVWGTTRDHPDGLLRARGRRARTARHQASSRRRRQVRQRRGARGRPDQGRSTSSASSLPDCPALLTSLLGFDTPADWNAHRRTCWCSWRSRCARTAAAARCSSCPPSSDDLARIDRRSRSRTPSTPPFTELAELVRDAPRRATASASGRTSSTTRSSAVAGLTAVDGATVLTDRYELLAFGAKITRRDGSPLVEQVDGHRADRRAAMRASSTRRSSAARGTCRPRSSCTTSATRSRSSPRRTAGSRLRVVAVRGHGARAPRRNAAALKSKRIAGQRSESLASCAMRPARSPCSIELRAATTSIQRRRLRVRARRGDARHCWRRSGRSPTGRRSPTAGTRSSSTPTWPTAAAIAGGGTRCSPPALRSAPSRASRTSRTIRRSTTTRCTAASRAGSSRSTTRSAGSER